LGLRGKSPRGFVCWRKRGTASREEGAAHKKIGGGKSYKTFEDGSTGKKTDASLSGPGGKKVTRRNEKETDISTRKKQTRRNAQRGVGALVLH